MHNIGRIQLETDTEMENYEAGQLEWLGETVFSEAEEMELAAQLMEVNSEEELDQFLGDLIRKAGRALGSFVSSPSGQAIGGILKGAVRQILPHAAGALGTFVGGPLGAQISSGLASMAGERDGSGKKSRTRRIASSTARGSSCVSAPIPSGTQSRRGRMSRRWRRRKPASPRRRMRWRRRCCSRPPSAWRRIGATMSLRRARPLAASRQHDRALRRLGQGIVIRSFAKSMLLHETRALLARLALVKPFALQEPMLPAAALLPAAEVAIDRFLVAGRRELRL